MAKNIRIKVALKGAKTALGALKNVTGAVKNLGKAATVIGAGFAGLSTKLAGDFQKNLLEISTLMDIDSVSMGKMGDQLKNVAGASGLALDSLSKARYDIVSAGFSGVSDSAQVLNSSMQLAVGGVTSAAEAADLLTTTINAYGLEAKDSQKLSDSLFTTVKFGKTTISELAQSLGQVLPFANSMNLSIDGVGAAMATLTAAGINTAEATTALKGTISALESPGKSAKKAMEEAGIEVKRFGNGSVDLFETMKQFEGVDPETLSKFVPNIRAQLGIKAMSGNLERLKFNIDGFAEAAETTESETTTAFEKMQTGFNNQMSKLKNNAQNGMIAVGNLLIKFIQPKIEAVNALFQKIGDIGWGTVGKRIQEDSDTVMKIMRLTFEHGMNMIKANVKSVALEIGQEIQIAVLGRFATDMSEQITEANEEAKIITESSLNSIKGMYKGLFALLTREKEEEAESFVENESSKIPPIKKVNQSLIAVNEATSSSLELSGLAKMADEERFATSISGARGLIKSLLAETVARFIAKEVGEKSFVGLVTGSLGAIAVTSLFDSVVPKFAGGGIVQGNPNKGDVVPIMATAGELILNQAQQENLASNNGITINISAPLVDETVVDSIIPAIEKAKRMNLA